MSRNLTRIVVLTVLGAMLFAPRVMAGTTGKLSGKVVNEKKEPLPGVNIRIEGQRLGAVSDDQGNYFIIGIPGGPTIPPGGMGMPGRPPWGTLAPACTMPDPPPGACTMFIGTLWDIM